MTLSASIRQEAVDLLGEQYPTVAPTTLHDIVSLLAPVLAEGLLRENAALRQERDEARDLCNRWMTAALYAVPSVTMAFDSMSPEAFGESRRHATDELEGRAIRAEAQLAAAREAKALLATTQAALLRTAEGSRKLEEALAHIASAVPDSWAGRRARSAISGEEFYDPAQPQGRPG